MTDTWDSPDLFGETEAVIRAAGNYVQPTSDLRPSVLEAAQEVAQEKLAIRWTNVAAAAALCAGLCMLAGEAAKSYPPLVASSATEAPSWRNFTASQLWATAAGSDQDAAWALVESFRSMRVRQSHALRDALRSRSPRQRSGDDRIGFSLLAPPS